MRNRIVCNPYGVEANQTLNEQLCFALYSAARVASNAYREELTALGLTYTQYVTLLALWERDGVTVWVTVQFCRCGAGRFGDVGDADRRPGRRE